jgi:hypothetical protein
MKCIKNASEVRKVSDEEAISMVKVGWAYCAKKEYKAVHGKKKAEVKEVLQEGDEIIIKKSKPIKMSKEDRMKGKAGSARIGGSKGG